MSRLSESYPGNEIFKFIFVIPTSLTLNLFWDIIMLIFLICRFDKELNKEVAIKVIDLEESWVYGLEYFFGVWSYVHYGVFQQELVFIYSPSPWRESATIANMEAAILYFTLVLHILYIIWAADLFHALLVYVSIVWIISQG